LLFLSKNILRSVWHLITTLKKSVVRQIWQAHEQKSWRCSLGKASLPGTRDWITTIVRACGLSKCSPCRSIRLALVGREVRKKMIVNYLKLIIGVTKSSFLCGLLEVSSMTTLLSSPPDVFFSPSALLCVQNNSLS
jgi:hypothetical protein